MRLLTTGGSGLLGSKVASIAAKKGYETYAGYNNHKAITAIPLPLNVCDKEAVTQAFKEIQPDAVVHAAALTNVDKCENEKALAWKVNVEGTKNIVESSEHHNTFLVYVSTDYVFPGDNGLYTENDKPQPINYYGQTKLDGETIVSTSSTSWCIARPSVIYGSTPAAGKVNFALWILEKLKERERIKIITDQWTSPTLNTNLAHMILETIERKLTGIYHLSGSTPLSRYDFAASIADTFHLEKSLISPTTSHEMNWIAKRPANTSLNVEKALSTLKNKPLTIHDALKKLKEEVWRSR